MGELFALGAALAWSGAVILFKKSGESVPPLTLNLFRVGISSLLFLLVLPAAGEPIASGAPWGDVFILAASAVLAIAVADTLFHMSLNRTGAGINAIVDCLYSPFVALFAFALLDERLGALQLGGMALVIAGVLLASGHTPPRGTSARTLLFGILCGALAMAALAIGIVIAKPVLERSSILWATAIRQWASLAVLLGLVLASPGRRQRLAVFRPSRAWRYSLPGTVLGSFLALMLWIGGMKYIEAGAAAILNQTSTIYILLLASLFLGEPFSRRKLVAAALALAGILCVTQA